MGVTPSETGSAGFAGGMQGLMEAAGYPTQTGEHVDRSNSPFENEMIERIIDAIEERVIAELERRGRRHHPGVF
jgi:hypothetical protein